MSLGYDVVLISISTVIAAELMGVNQHAMHSTQRKSFPLVEAAQHYLPPWGPTLLNKPNNICLLQNLVFIQIGFFSEAGNIFKHK